MGSNAESGGIVFARIVVELIDPHQHGAADGADLAADTLVSQTRYAAYRAGSPVYVENAGFVKLREVTIGYELPSDKKAKSDAYFEGGYWLILWDFVTTAARHLQVRAGVELRDGDGGLRDDHEGPPADRRGPGARRPR